MILDSTTKKIQVVLAAAIATTNPVVIASYADMSATALVGGNNIVNANGTTAVDVVAAPAASTQRQLKFMTVYNADTAAVTVTVQLNNGGTISPAVKVTLPSGYTLNFTPEGWRVTDTNGSFVSTGGGSSSGGLGSSVTALSIVSGVVNIDCSKGDYYTLVLNANVTSITFSNLPASGTGRSLMIRFQQDGTGGRTVAFPSSLKAMTGSTTSVVAGANLYTVMALSTVDSGTRWEYAMQPGGV